MQGSNRWADKSTSFHATTKSATSGFTSPALAAEKANQKNLRPTSRNSPKHNVLDALIRSENANWRNNAKQDHLGRQTQNCRRQQFNKGSIRSPSHGRVVLPKKAGPHRKKEPKPILRLPREQPELAGFSDACRRLSHDARRCRPSNG